MILDEKDHYGQIRIFHEGAFELYRRPGEELPKNATLPGFHAAAAAYAKLAGSCTPETIRIFNILAGIGAAVLAWITARELHGPDIALTRALQLFFLPVLFPFIFLIYTDVFSLMLVLAAFLACVRKKYIISGLFALAAVAARQNNIVFVLFLAAYSYVDAFGFKISSDRLRKHALELLPYALICAGFAIFAIARGSIAMNRDHQLALSAGNILFSLFSCAVLFLPVHMVNRKRIQRRVSSRKICFFAVSAAILIAVMLYVPGHRYNRIPWLLRNEILSWLLRDIWGRTVFACAVLLAVSSLLSTKLAGRAGYLLYPFWLLVLLPHLLVEPRYYIIPFALLVLLRKKQNPYLEIALVLWFIIFSTAIHHMHCSSIYVI